MLPSFLSFSFIDDKAIIVHKHLYDKCLLVGGGSFDNRGKTYKVANILTDDKVFDEAKYKEYSPIFLSTTFVIS
jgi:hypothetical protein